MEAPIWGSSQLPMHTIIHIYITKISILKRNEIGERRERVGFFSVIPKYRKKTAKYKLERMLSLSTG